jgi:hypothetical protein
MSSNGAVETGLTTCLFCSLGCRAGLALGGPEQYIPDYSEGSAGDYAGLCARGSMLAELTNHHARLLWPLVRGVGGYRETTLESALERAGETLRVGSVNSHPRAFLDGNFDLASLARAAAALQKILPKQRIAIYLPEADAALLAGCEASEADYLSPARLSEADAILMVGNPFTTHPVVAHWVLDRATSARRSVMVLDARAGVTYAYATSPWVVRPGQEHAALAAVAHGLGVKGCEAASHGLDAAKAEEWAKALAAAKKPAVIVAAEFGRAARWFELGLLAGEIARVRGGGLLPLTVYGNALGAARLSARLGLGDFASLAAAAREESSGLILAFGEGMAERVAGAGQCVAAMSLAPEGPASCSTVLPVAWPFEMGGPVLMPGVGMVMSQPAIRPPSGVPALGDLAAAIAGGPGVPLSDLSSLARLQGGGAAMDLSALAVSGSGDGLAVVLAGDSVNFADGAITRRVSFAKHIFPQPAISLSAADAARLSVTDGHLVRVSGTAGSLTARVEVEEGQSAGWAVLSGAYAESQRVVGAAPGDGPRGPVRVTVAP